MKTIPLAVGWCVLAWTVGFAQEPTPTPAGLPPVAAAPLPPVVTRYEQMLAGSPGKGTAFDKVYQHFFEGAGLDALAARWHARAEGGGPGAETFYLLEGLLAERRAHPDAARERYQQYTRAHPEDPRGWTALGELETSEGRFGPSADALARALAPDARPPVPAATRPTLYRELARAQTRNFLVANALSTWRKLAAEYPDDPTVLQEVGEALQEGQAWDDARGTFEKLRDMAGRNGDAFGKINATLHLGQVEEARGHAAEAVKVYEGVVADAKAGSWLEREARSRIETLYRSQEDLPGLADYYKKWLEDHPRDIEVATRRAAVLVELNRKTEAIDLLKEAVVWAPDRQELQVELARRLAESDRPAEAATVMEKLTAVAPEEKSYWVLLGDARWQLLSTNPPGASADEKAKWRKDALDAWNHLAPADGKDAVAAGKLADLLADHHLTDEALAQFARAAALAPDLPDLRERWAAYLAQLNRKDDARHVLAGIVDADPKNATAANYARLASALDRLDDTDGALDATAKGLALEPRSFDLLALRWQLLSTRKNWDDAIALYPALLAAAPNVYFTEQVQVRHISALAAGGKLADFRKTLGARLTAVTDPAKGAPLDESDLGLLVRADLQASSGENEEETLGEARRALAQGRERFPKSAALVRLEVELAKRAHDAPAQVAAWRRLIDIQPAQKTDALQEIVRVWRDADRPDDALAAANELLAASPANTSAHLLLADLLLQSGQPDEGLARLREAVRLSDKPNEIRLRLARAESELGHTAAARQALDEAFEAAADARERLTLMKGLAEAYQREGKLDELIARFQHLQQAEADGWRYALYLADIYQQTQDNAGARRELAKALAARPKDGSLLRQLVRLASEEGNTAETARYQALLTEAEPSDNNQFALVKALLANNQGAEALTALQAHLAAVLKTPGAWDDLLPLLAKNQLTAKAGAILTRELGGEKSDVSNRFTLALFQLSAGDLDEAKRALWSIFAAKSPRSTAAPPAPPPANAASPLAGNAYMIFYGGGGSIPEMRLRDVEQKREAAQALIDPATNQGRTIFRTTTIPGAALPNRPDPVDAARDSALVYLAAIAVKQDAAPAFLAELDRQLAARDSSRADRIIAYASVDATDRLLPEIAAQVKAPEEGLDTLCAGRLFGLAFTNNPQYRAYQSSPLLTEEQTRAMRPLGQPLLQRILAAHPEVEEIKDVVWYSFLKGIDRKEEAEIVRREVLARADEHATVRQLSQALSLLVEGSFPAEDRAQIHRVSRALSARIDRTRKSGLARQEFVYYPTMLFQTESEAAKLSPEDFAAELADLMLLWYPSAPPPPGASISASSAQTYYYNIGVNSPRDQNFLPATRYLAPDVQGMMRQLGTLLSQGGDDARRAALGVQLAKQARELPAAQQIFPALVSVYLDFWGGNASGALAGAQKLVEARPDDSELRLLAAILLGRNDKPAEALALLGGIQGPRSGDTAITVQQATLVFAKAAHNTDAAKEAALKLAAMRLPAEERTALAADLRELGLNEKADQLARAPAAIATGGSRRYSAQRPTSIFDYQTGGQLQTLERDKNEGGTLALVRNILAALPPPDQSQGNADYVLRQAVGALDRLHKKDEFIAEAQKQLAQDPDSLTLNYQLAVLCDGRGNPSSSNAQRTTTRGGISGSTWLRLRRNGDEVVGSYSTDGQTWQTLAHQTIGLGDKFWAALAITGRAGPSNPGSGDAMSAALDHVSVDPELAAPGDAPTGAASAALPTPWRELEIRPEAGRNGPPPDAPAAAVRASVEHEGSFTLRGAGGTASGTSFTGRLIYRPAGDAKELVARVASFDNPGGDAVAGIMWRTDPAPDAPYVAMLVRQSQSVSFQFRPGAGPSLQYWRRLVALRPKNGYYVRQLIEQLARQGQREEGAAVFEALVENNPDEALGNWIDYRTIYAEDQMPRVAEKLLAWKPSASAPNQVRNVGSSFSTVAQGCIEQKRPDLAISLCRRGIELDEAAGYGGDQDLRKLLVKTLLDQKRRDEARDVLLAGFITPSNGQTSGGKPPTGAQLGFNSRQSYNRNYQNNWLWNTSWSDAGVEMRGLEPLEIARQQGMLPDLENAIRARLAEPDGKQLGDSGLDWLLTLCRLHRHDPTLLDELPAQLNAKPTNGNSVLTNNPQPYLGLLMTVGGMLMQWPGHEKLALEAFRAADKIRNGKLRNFGGNLEYIVAQQEARAEAQLGESAAVAALGNLLGKPAPQGGMINADANRRGMALLLHAAGPETDPAYVAVYDRVSQGAQGAKDYYFAYGLEKAQRVGSDPHYTALAWLLDDRGDGPDATLVYELRARHPYDRNGLGKYPGSRGRSFPGSEGERTLTFHYGRDAEHFAPVGELKTAATFGTWKGPIPAGGGVLKVTIDAPRESDAKALAAEEAARAAATPSPGPSPGPSVSPSPSPGLTLGNMSNVRLDAGPSPTATPVPPSGDYYLRVVRATNLLVNPDFDGLADRDPNAEKFSLPGWKDLPAGIWLHGTLNSPRPGRKFVQCETFPRQERIIYGERIPLERGRAYFQSAWLRDAGDGSGDRFGRRYLDADGKVLKTSECPDTGMLMWRWISQRLQPGNGGKDDDTIPEGAAFIEPFIKMTGSADWTGLFVGKME